MNIKPTNKLSALICVICGLTLLPLTLSAQNAVITSSTTESGRSYHDVSDSAALSVSGNGVVYNGTDIILTATFNGNSSGDDIEIGGRGAYAGSGATLLLTGGSINTSGSYGYGVWLDRSSTGTLNNVNVVTQAERGYGVFVRDNTNLTLTGGSVSTMGTRAYAVRFTLGSTGTVSNTTISTQGDAAFGVTVETASNLTLTDSDISVTGNNAYAVYVTGTSQATVNLNNNTLSGTGTNATSGSIYAYNDSTVTVTGSNGSVITGDVRAITSGTVDITLTTSSELHGNFIQDATAATTLKLTLGTGALLEGSGTLDSLTLENGAVIGYTGLITVTDSITIGGTVTIDFSNLTETGAYNILNWSGASVTGDITDLQFTNETAGVEGTFTVANNRLTFNATAVPEPSTYFLMGAGLGLLLLTAHYRRCKAQS
jgi:autotransporter family porin